MKTILGLDLGTNSIGWALLGYDFTKRSGNIIGMGSRILPMSQFPNKLFVLDKFVPKITFYTTKFIMYIKKLHGVRRAKKFFGL